MIMNHQLQKIMIIKHLQRLGIEHDLIDIDAEIDSTLTLNENLQSIMEYAKSSVDDKGMIRCREAGLPKHYSEDQMKNAINRWIRWQMYHKDMTRPLQDFL